MAVSTTNAISGPYTANGATTVFPFTFTAPSADEVAVIKRDGDGVDTTVSSSDYTVALTTGGGGSVTFTSAPASGNSIYVLLEPDFTQQIEFENGSAWLAGPVNEGYDRAAARAQALKRETDRSLKTPLGEGGITLPSVSGRAGKWLTFDADGNVSLAVGGGSDGELRVDLAGSSGAALIGAAGGGSVQTALDRLSFHVDRYGAVGDGTTDDGPAIALAIAAASVAGGTVQFDGSKTYVNNDVQWVIAPNVVLDGQGCLITGSGRFYIAGNVGILTLSTITEANYSTSGADGGWDNCVENSGMRNFRFGGSHYGPRYWWVRNGICSNLISEPGRTAGTFLNLQFCDGLEGSNITIWDSEITKIGVLFLHTRNCRLSNVKLLGGEYVYGIQIKGGWNNVVSHGVLDGITVTHGFRIRGDAPFQSSDTDPVTTYPFADLNGEATRAAAWTSLDARRATRTSYFRDCIAKNTAGIHFYAQEFIDCGLDDCESDASATQNCAAGKSFASGERGFRLINFTAEGDAGSGRGINISGYSLTDQLEDLRIEGGKVSGFTSATAMRLTYCRKPDIRNLRADDNTGQVGVEVIDCEEPNLARLKGSGNGIGLSVTSANLTQGRTATITMPAITGTSANISNGDAHRLTAGMGHTAQLTAAATNNTLQRYNIPTGETRMIYAKVLQIRRDSGATRITERKCAATNTAGAVSFVGTSGGDVISDYDGSSASLASSFTISGTQVRLNLVSGVAVTTDHYILESRMETF